MSSNVMSLSLSTHLLALLFLNILVHCHSLVHYYPACHDCILSAKHHWLVIHGFQTVNGCPLTCLCFCLGMADSKDIDLQ